MSFVDVRPVADALKPSAKALGRVILQREVEELVKVDSAGRCEHIQRPRIPGKTPGLLSDHVFILRIRAQARFGNRRHEIRSQFRKRLRRTAKLGFVRFDGGHQRAASVGKFPKSVEPNLFTDYNAGEKATQTRR